MTCQRPATTRLPDLRAVLAYTGGFIRIEIHLDLVPTPYLWAKDTPESPFSVPRSRG